MYRQKLLLFSLLLISIMLTDNASLAKQSEQFDLKIVPTLDHQLDSWLKIPAELKPTIHFPAKIYPNQPFELRILFKGYKLAEKNHVDMTYDVQFFYPDGTPTADQGKDLLGYNNTVRHKNYIIINQQLLTVFFDESYPFGEYEIRVTARDNIAEKTISRSDKIELAPFERIAQFASADFYSFWIKNHFRQPDVAKALFGTMQFLTDNPEWWQNNIELTGFAHRLLHDNPWVWGHLTTLYRTSPDDRDKIIALMALSDKLIPEIAASLNEKQKNTFQRLQKSLRPITEPGTGQIAWLWGEFYASGHLEPIEKIVRYLKPFALSPAEGVRLTTEKPEEFAFWSLVDNGQEVPLATTYYAFLLDHGDLGPENKIQLRLVLEVIEKALKEKENMDASTQQKNTPISDEIGVPLRK